MMMMMMTTMDDVKQHEWSSNDDGDDNGDDYEEPISPTRRQRKQRQQQEPPPSSRKSNRRSLVLATVAILLLLLIGAGLALWFLLLAPSPTQQLDQNAAAATNAAQQQPALPPQPQLDQPQPEDGTNNGAPPSPNDNASPGPPPPPPAPLATPPTAAPAPPPTASPSLRPITTAPTTARPTSDPTTAPTPTQSALFVPPYPVPALPDPSYFNYNSNDTVYGPQAWATIETRRSSSSSKQNNYWQEFGANGFGPWQNHLSSWIADPETNRCGPPRLQSPVDLTPSQTECTAIHQIRTLAGKLSLTSQMIEKRFESNALRLLFNRRTCLDLNNQDCKTYRPPVADFPNYSSQVTHLADLMHLDIKTGEHTFGGRRFDAELQLMHMHLDDPRVGYVAIPVRAQPGNYSEPFQAVLDEFQNIYNIHQAECAAARQTRRRGSALDVEGSPSSSTLSTNNDPDLQQRRLRRRRLLEAFDPYADFLKTVYFYRYDGSSPDPPCFPVTWFVMTTPLVIGPNQLRQMKELLFTHVNPDCQPTSVHNLEQSVARPVQPLGVWRETGKAREVMLCTAENFSPDPNKGNSSPDAGDGI